MNGFTSANDQMQYLFLESVQSLISILLILHITTIRTSHRLFVCLFILKIYINYLIIFFEQITQ